MELPRGIERYLNQVFLASRDFAWLAADPEGRLLDAGGRLDLYGLDRLAPGDEVESSVAFLAGMLPLNGQPDLLVGVEFGDDILLDIHFVPAEDKDWVLLVSSGAEGALDRLLQQRSNEAGLLRERLEKQEQAQRATAASADSAQKAVDAERRRVLRLLHSVFPERIAERIRRGEQPSLEESEAATLIAVEILNFDDILTGQSPEERARSAELLFQAIDGCAQSFGLWRLQVVGEVWIAAAGLAKPEPDGLEACIELAEALPPALHELDTGGGAAISVRSAISVGPLRAGASRERVWRFHVWGRALREALGHLDEAEAASFVLTPSAKQARE